MYSAYCKMCLQTQAAVHQKHNHPYHSRLPIKLGAMTSKIIDMMIYLVPLPLPRSFTAQVSHNTQTLSSQFCKLICILIQQRIIAQSCPRDTRGSADLPIGVKTLCDAVPTDITVIEFAQGTLVAHHLHC